MAHSSGYTGACWTRTGEVIKVSCQSYLTYSEDGTAAVKMMPLKEIHNLDRTNQKYRQQNMYVA